MQGSCLCGKVSYQISGKVRSVVACHCTQCRKTSGHYVAATQAARDTLEISGADHLTWYVSSQTAKRAFCSTCGSQMFWTALGTDTISIMAGTLDGPTGLRLDRQICIADKGDYYDLPDADCVAASAV